MAAVVVGSIRGACGAHGREVDDIVGVDGEEVDDLADGLLGGRRVEAEGLVRDRVRQVAAQPRPHQPAVGKRVRVRDGAAQRTERHEGAKGEGARLDLCEGPKRSEGVDWGGLWRKGRGIPEGADGLLMAGSGSRKAA